MISKKRLLFSFTALLLTITPLFAQPAPAKPDRLAKRWFFVWRDMSNPQEVDRMIARFPEAKAAGYNAVVFAANVAKEKATDLREAARKNGLGLVAVVMGGARDRNYVEGVPVKDSLFIAHADRAIHQNDNAPVIKNADFEEVSSNHFTGWAWQDDEGVTTFADHTVVHSGKTSLRMESIAKNEARHCRISQPIQLTPFRQYHISVWVKSENLSPADPEIKVLSADSSTAVSFQTFHTEQTQDWKRVDLVFNSLNTTAANLYLGSWYGKDGKVWWDDLKIEEIGLVNALQRPGCPITVRSESGIFYEEGRDYQKIIDPQMHPWIPFHDTPVIHLTPGTRIKDGEKLRVSYYHPVVVYEDRINYCLSEPKVLEDWRQEVREANDLLHPAAFLMSHDEIRVMNWCAACQAKKMTAGELLAWNVRQAAQIIRNIRPDAGIWVWNDMFDPMHNAIDHYYAVNGSLKGSWKGLNKDVGIVNWHGGLAGKNCAFFAELGLRQILSGYYDGDEDGAAIAQWRANTRDVPGIVGAMYTTWEDRYSALVPWASRAFREIQPSAPSRLPNGVK